MESASCEGVLAPMEPLHTSTLTITLNNILGQLGFFITITGRLLGARKIKRYRSIVSCTLVIVLYIAAFMAAINSEDFLENEREPSDNQSGKENLELRKLIEDVEKALFKLRDNIPTPSEDQMFESYCKILREVTGNKPERLSKLREKLRMILDNLSSH